MLIPNMMFDYMVYCIEIGELFTTFSSTQSWYVILAVIKHIQSPNNCALMAWFSITLNTHTHTHISHTYTPHILSLHCTHIYSHLMCQSDLNVNTFV